MSKRFFARIIFLIFCLAFSYPRLQASRYPGDGRIIIVKMGIEAQQISREWRAALYNRMNKEEIDSMGGLKRELTTEESEWRNLIVSKAAEWNSYRDSLVIPFQGIILPDTVYVMLGFLGNDDAFTFEKHTVCLDLTALSRVYGKAGVGDNSSKISRIFAHEYTHLLHKEWARKTAYHSRTFLDDILWECLYEGFGMYRSLNPQWLPANDTLRPLTQAALQQLYPIFTERIITIKKNDSLSDIEKRRLHDNLSRGPVNKKWGAFPVAIWLSLEAKGDERKLIKWIDKGPMAVIELAKKYLPAVDQDKLSEVF